MNTNLPVDLQIYIAATSSRPYPYLSKHPKLDEEAARYLFGHLLKYLRDGWFTDRFALISLRYLSMNPRTPEDVFIRMLDINSPEFVGRAKEALAQTALSFLP